MPDPTAPVLTAAYASALGIFIAAALLRWRSRKSIPPMPVEIDAAAAAEPPPPLPYGIPLWLYGKFDFLWAAFIFAVFCSLSIANTTVDPEKIEFTPGMLIGSMGFHITFAVLTTLVIAWRIHPARWLGLRWPQWPWVFLIAPATVLAMWILFGSLQAAGYMKWIESLGVETTQDSVKLLQTATDPAILALMAIAAVIVAPICEEIVFRGYLYPFAKKFTGTWTAAICSGLIFSAAHGSLAALLPLFVFGIVLALVYQKTGSIWAPIAIHFCFNGATVALQTVVRKFPHLIEEAQKATGFIFP